jgi:hypothetical protein
VIILVQLFNNTLEKFMPNEIEKAAYIRMKYNNIPNLAWEKNLRSNSQLVSEKITTEDEAIKILRDLFENEPFVNKQAYFKVASSTGGFRICVNVDQINQWHDWRGNVSFVISAFPTLKSEHKNIMVEKAMYVRGLYNNVPNLTWNMTLIGDSQLVSDEITLKDGAQKILSRLLEREPQVNEQAYFLERSSRGGFRIRINLACINEWHDADFCAHFASPVPTALPIVVRKPTLYEKIVSFLNKVHLPLVTEGDNAFQCFWRLERGIILCKGPSREYVKFRLDTTGAIVMQDVNGALVENKLRTQFSQAAQNAGFDASTILQFNKSLSVEDHHHASYFSLTDPVMMDILAVLTKRYENDASRHFRAQVAGSALGSKLPQSVLLFKVGLFLNIRDASFLAQVNKASRAAALVGKALDDQEMQRSENPAPLSAAACNS